MLDPGQQAGARKTRRAVNGTPALLMKHEGAATGRPFASCSRCSVNSYQLPVGQPVPGAIGVHSRVMTPFSFLMVNFSLSVASACTR